MKSSVVSQQDSSHDALTGLANQTLFIQRLRHAMAGRQTSVPVLFAYIDDFAAINRAHGQRLADKLLVAVAGRLTRLVGPQDTSARLDGDTFVVLAQAADDGPALDSLTRRIDVALNGMYGLDGTQVPVNCTVGHCLAGGTDDGAATIVDQTGIAIRRARATRRGDQGTIDLTALTPYRCRAALPQASRPASVVTGPPGAG